MNLDRFEELVDHRRATRKFKSGQIPEEVLERLLRVSQKTPSGFNLQPTHFYVIKERKNKEAILKPCMRQQAIHSAPVVVVFAADRDVAKHHFEKVSLQDQEAGAITEQERENSRLFVDMNFSHKPLGMGWVAKAFFAPLLRLLSPTPSLPAVYKREWLSTHVGLSAMTFMLAAESAGLATCPILSFDEGRLKKALSIPRRLVVPLIVALGYPESRPPKRSRLSLEEVIHWK
jgi:nitroreductase